MSPSQLEQLLSLSVEERIQLVEAIWDRIADRRDSLPVAGAQRAELDRRLAARGRREAGLRFETS